MSYTITIKFDVEIEGKIEGYDAYIKEAYYKWIDLNSEVDADYIIQKINKIMKKLDKFEMLTLRLTNGDYSYPETFNAKRYVKKFNEYQKMELDEGNKRYEIIKEYDNEKDFKKDYKKDVIELVREIERRHLESMYTELKKSS